MEVHKVKVHTCYQHKPGMQQDKPLSPEKCRCRQMISVVKAALEVERGLAQYVVVAERPVDTLETCNVCGGLDALKKTCQACGRTGQITVTKIHKVLGQDIIYISLDGKTNSKTTKVKKSPTIEKAHIERSYVNEIKEEQERIEAYGQSQAMFFAELGAQIRNSRGEILIPGNPEPEDNRNTATGRRYDWGRSI